MVTGTAIFNRRRLAMKLYTIYILLLVITINAQVVIDTKDIIDTVSLKDTSLLEKIIYYENGNIKARFHYKDGGAFHGRYEVFLPNGDFKTTGWYMDAKQVGWWKQYQKKTSGVCNYYDKKGNLIKTTVFDDTDTLNVAIEKSELYYENGILKARFHHKQGGVLHGAYEVFYPNGTPKVSGTYVNDKKTGVWYYFNEDGSLSDEVVTENELAIATKRSFCDSSYDVGMYLANDIYSSAGWFAGGVCIGLGTGLIGTGIYVLLTKISNCRTDSIPANIDESCYFKGYEDAAVHKRKRSAACGGILGSIAAGVTTLILVSAL